MASTYTLNNGIEKPATGEQSGTWGATTNTNFDIIDRALNGVGTITLDGTTHTLSTSDGALSDGGYRVLVLSGSPSGTNTITVSPNNAAKFYIVYNNSGQSVVFTQGSGGNVTVLNGSKKIIFCNGVGAGSEVTDVTDSLDVSNFRIDGTAITSSATELNILDGVTSTTAELNILDGATLSTAELNKLDGVTATTTELNYVDTTAGTVAASKAVIADANRDVSNIRNLSVTGDITSGDLVLDNNVQNRVNNVDGTSGRWRIQEGQSNLYIINELDGKKYRFALELVE